MNKKPILQGHLDGLCGVYSSINSINSLLPNNKLTKENSIDLFKIATAYLEDKKVLKSALVDGFTIGYLTGILNAYKPYLSETFGYTLKNEKITFASGNITGMWNIINTFLNQDFKTTAIIGINSQTYSHWTTIIEATEKQWKLCDSDNMKIINKSSLTSGELTKDKTISIAHNEVIGLYFEE